MPFYVVWNGRKPGIYKDWESCHTQVSGFSGAKYKKFKTEQEALASFHENSSQAPVPTASSVPVPSTRLSSTSLPAKRAHSNISKDPINFLAPLQDPTPLNSRRVYTDGSSHGQKIGGVGVYWPGGENESFAEKIPPFIKQTNGSAEIAAILRALVEDKEPHRHLTVYSDSQYAVNTVNSWIYQWAKNGWKRSDGAPLANLSLIKNLFKELKKRPNLVKASWVRGHATDPANIQADALANQGASMPSSPPYHECYGDPTGP